MKAENFLTLEDSLTKRIYSVWESENEKTLREIQAAIEDARFLEALELSKTLTFSVADKKLKTYIKTVSTSAVYFGASNVVSTNEIGTPPEQINSVSDKATELLIMALGNLDLHFTRLISKYIDKSQREYQESRESGEVSKSFSRPFVSYAKLHAEGAINFTSSLHTSRLASWGFLNECEFQGYVEYKISEMLDPRTCPICSRMHGRKFKVAPAKKKLDSWLSVTDPDQLKSIAPFPRQDSVSLALFDRLSNEDLVKRGWDTPPYHPRCRGILVKVSEKIERRPIRLPSRGIEALNPNKPEPKPKKRPAVPMQTVREVWDLLNSGVPENQIMSILGITAAQLDEAKRLSGG
jgi:hypothetical protein